MRNIVKAGLLLMLLGVVLAEERGASDSSPADQASPVDPVLPPTPELWDIYSQVIEAEGLTGSFSKSEAKLYTRKLWDLGSELLGRSS